MKIFISMLSPLQQSIDLIQKNENILIVLPQGINGDSVGSALAMHSALKKMGKKSEIVCQEKTPERLLFLPGANEIKEDIFPLRDFIISIDTSKGKILKLRYENENNNLRIFLSSRDKIEEKSIKLEPGPYRYGLIIAIDSPDLESLGRIFETNAELFFSHSVLNIDCKSGNEYFGEVNLVEPTAAACSQIVFDLIQAIDPNLIDESAATCLLAGLIAKTRSFQNSKTSPQVFNLASILITKGADQEKINKNLYKTRPLNRIRLWGRLLSKMEFEPEKKTIWLKANQEDFSQTQTSQQDLPFILEEMSEFFPQAHSSFILWMDENGFIWVLAQARQPEILQRINLELGGTLKNDKLVISLNKTDPDMAKEQISVLLNSMG
ncbi:MAG: hypothetical protein UV34_C0029G0003 [Parcubacteria group bacterium GW2011_GWB1_42_6]|nr:MAG: hypothetical protein UV34_C0029G0003 [Parcubacteria group bacterium GW2011_GWB1_42_6]